MAADTRFFTHQPSLTLAELARLSGATLADASLGSRVIEGVSPLDRAETRHISFLDNTKYTQVFASSKAGACILREKYAELAPAGMALLLSEDPYRAYALVAQAFYPPAPLVEGRAATAFVHPKATIGKNVQIAPGAVIEEGCEIGDSTLIGPCAVIGRGVRIGEGCRIGGLAALSYALIGNHVILHPGVKIGQDGFGFAPGRDEHVKVPQLGRVIIEDHVEIGANSCIDRGSGPDTVIGQGTKIDNLVQIGHNVHIGRGCIIVAQVGIAGSTRIGDFCMLGGQVGISGHIRISAGVKLAAKSGVFEDITAPGTYGGFPAVPVKEWHRQSLAIAKLARRRPQEVSEG